MQQAREVFDCDKCSTKNCDDSNPAPYPKWSIRGVIESRTCLLPMVTDRSWFFIRLSTQHAANILPKSGGWLDQPNVFIEAMELIGSHRARIASEKNGKR